MSTHALYYPSMHFQDTAWLKAALLYWDGIHRMVPDAHAIELRSEPTEVRLACDQELVTPIEVASYVPQIENDTFQLIEKLADMKDDRQSVEALLRERATFGEHVEFDISAALERFAKHRGVEVDLHRAKLTDSLISALERAGLGRSETDGVYVHQVVGALYMSALAGRVSDSVQCQRVTDYSANHWFGNMFASKHAREPTAVLHQISAAFPDRERLRDIPMQKIVDFCRKHSAERRRFKNAVETLVATLCTTDDEIAKKDRLSSIRGEIEEALQAHQAALEDNKTLGLRAILSFGLPAGLISLAKSVGLGPASMAILGVASGGISTISMWTEYRSKRAAIEEKNRWQYLLALKKAL